MADGRYGAALRELQGRQKTARGVPAYLRYVNRPLGMRIAARAFVTGRTPDQLTVVGTVATYGALVAVALVPPHPLLSAALALVLLAAFALDSADGQLARLRGGGSATGEWLDDVADAIKHVLIHGAVLVSWLRRDLVDPSWLVLLPVGYLGVDIVFFFTAMLTEQLKRHGPAARPAVAVREPGALRALVLLPTDYAVMCLLLGVLWWRQGFLVAYAVLAVCNLGYLLMLLPKWYSDLRALDRAGRAG